MKRQSIEYEYWQCKYVVDWYFVTGHLGRLIFVGLIFWLRMTMSTEKGREGGVVFRMIAIYFSIVLPFDLMKGRN